MNIHFYGVENKKGDRSTNKEQSNREKAEQNQREK